MLAIIGTAGRKNDLDKSDFVRMYRHAKKMVKSLEIDHVISGGSSWSDHVAVKLFLRKKIASLTLELPCDFDMKNQQYFDTNQCDWLLNPGGTLNYYHRKFSNARGKSSLEEISKAITGGAKVCIHKSLHERNRHIARLCDTLLAYGTNDVPADGGTKYTFDQCKLFPDKKFYINIKNIHK